jgi:hypothetical protein
MTTSHGLHSSARRIQEARPAAVLGAQHPLDHRDQFRVLITGSRGISRLPGSTHCES